MSQQSSEISFGSDSFLDVMANMVGILIILVTIAVMHASRSGQGEVSGGARAARSAQVEALTNQSQAIESQIDALAGQSRSFESQAAQRQADIERLAGSLSDRRKELDARRQQLDEKARHKQDLQLALVSARSELKEIETEVAKKRNEHQTTTIECYPTPISRTVSGKEIHFRLWGGRIVYVPLDELMAVFEHEARSRVELLRERPMISGMVGPEGDFRMRYSLERQEMPGGRFRVEAMFTFLPVQDQLGETLEAAFQPDSELQEILKRERPRQTTVTLWTYPDSFALYRTLKKELYNRGFAVAGRPLEFDQPIGASTSGSRSAAQ